MNAILKSTLVVRWFTSIYHEYLYRESCTKQQRTGAFLLEPKARNIIISIAVIIILLGGALTAFFILPTSSNIRHFERNFSGTKTVQLLIAGLEDCVLTMDYEENEELMYRIDIVLYDADETLYFEYRQGTFEHFVEMNWGNHYGSTTRAKSMNITLGTGHPYYIVLGGDSNSRNVTGNVAFDNNATLGNETFAYLFPGSLNLLFTEDVDFSQGGLDMEIGKSGEEIASVSMHIDLPVGMDGHAVFRSESIGITTSEWTMYDQTSNPTTKYYRTSAELTKPLLDIDKVYADSIQATLLT
jgi:hypothetical protein